MTRNPILTIAVPTFNMEHCLRKNLSTYRDQRLWGMLEVLCLNNASEDRSQQIIQGFAEECPEIFSQLNRDSRGYGASVNAAISIARGRYFRIIDADDWVNTEALIKLVEILKDCDADIVLTDYQIVDMQTGRMTPMTARARGIPYYQIFSDWSVCTILLPSIHSTTYRTDLLREGGFVMQDDLFFVDEEYVILPYLWAKSAICYPLDVCRYQVADPNQSTSPRNRARYFSHREKVLRHLIGAYQTAVREDSGLRALHYCFSRIKNGIGDHFTTLYLYVEDRGQGRRLAKEWRHYIRQTAPEFWPYVKKKTWILAILNRLPISLEQYTMGKKLLLPKKRKRWETQ